MDVAALDDGCAVVERAAVGYGHTHERRYAEVAAELHEFQQRGFGFVEQRLLLEEVLAGVGADGKFGQADDACAGCFGLQHHVFNLLRIEGTVRHRYSGYGSCHFYKSVLHMVSV